jgi:hypothetical protein
MKSFASLERLIKRLEDAFGDGQKTEATTDPIVAAAALEVIDAATPPDWDAAEGPHPDALAAMERVAREAEAAVNGGRGDEFLAELRARCKQQRASQ